MNQIVGAICVAIFFGVILGVIYITAFAFGLIGG